MASQTRSGRFQVGDKVQLAVTGRRGRVVGGAADSLFYDRGAVVYAVAKRMVEAR